VRRAHRGTRAGELVHLLPHLRLRIEGDRGGAARGRVREGPAPSPPHVLLHLLPHLRLRIEGGARG
jgi:hypothetical protein